MKSSASTSYSVDFCFFSSITSTLDSTLTNASPENAGETARKSYASYIYYTFLLLFIL